MGSEHFILKPPRPRATRQAHVVGSALGQRVVAQWYWRSHRCHLWCRPGRIVIMHTSMRPHAVQCWARKVSRGAGTPMKTESAQCIAFTGTSGVLPGRHLTYAFVAVQVALILCVHLFAQRLRDRRLLC